MNTRWLTAKAVAAVLVVAAITAPATAVAQSPAPAGSPAAAAGACSEEYVWVGALSTLPLFEARDFPALQAHAKELGVCARVSGPATFDVPGELAAIEQECAGQPAGIMVLGLDASLASAIDKCIDAKVPVVTVDVDVPGSKRLSMIGDDSVKLGKFLAQKIPADLIRRGITSGSIAITAALTNPSTLVIIDNFKAELANQQAFTLATVEEDSNTAEGGAAAEAAILSGYPDLVASLHLNSESGLGASTAVNEAGKKGQVCVYSAENDTEYAKKVQTGDICGFFGPRRELHTYYGLQALYDFNHTTVVVDGLDKWGTPPIPAFYNVGDIWVDQTNIDEYLAGK